MLLTLDVGNTNVTIGVFDGESLRATWRFATDVEKLPDEFGVLMLSLARHEGLGKSDISEAVIACVVPDLEPVFEQVCQRYFGTKPLHVTAGVRTGLRILYDTPRDVGAHRGADAVASVKQYGPPLIVVHLGPPTRFDRVTREGGHLG